MSSRKFYESTYHVDNAANGSAFTVGIYSFYKVLTLSTVLVFMAFLWLASESYAEEELYPLGPPQYPPGSQQTDPQHNIVDSFFYEVKRTYIIPSGLKIRFLEERRPALLSVILGHALRKQRQYAYGNPYWEDKIKDIHLEVFDYLSDVAKITYWQPPVHDATSIEEGLREIALTAMKGKWGDTIWEDLGIEPRYMRSVFR